MRKVRLFGMIAFTLILLSMLSLPEGFAKNNFKGGSPFHPPITEVIQAVTDPSGGCTGVSPVSIESFTHPDGHGLVTISTSRYAYQYVLLKHANPNSVYSVSIGYLKSNGGCDGTWQSLGSIITDQAGNGYVVQHLSLKSNEYQVQLRDSNGNLVYATPFISV